MSEEPTHCWMCVWMCVVHYIVHFYRKLDFCLVYYTVHLSTLKCTCIHHFHTRSVFITLCTVGSTLSIVSYIVHQLVHSYPFWSTSILQQSRCQVITGHVFTALGILSRLSENAHVSSALSSSIIFLMVHFLSYQEGQVLIGCVSVCSTLKSTYGII